MTKIRLGPLAMSAKAMSFIAIPSLLLLLPLPLQTQAANVPLLAQTCA